MTITKKIKIEGDFIDSFIYSGSLFLIDTQLRLTSYAWNEILNYTNCPTVNWNLLHNCFSKNNTQNISQLDNEYIIYHNSLNSLIIDTLELDSWPTDLDIYKNKFIISSADGIKSVVGNRSIENRKVKFEFSQNVKKMWDEKVFELAVGTLDRLIISCGYEGAFELFTRTKADSYELIKEKQLSAKEWIGCEWDQNTGIAILKNQLKQELLKFETINQDHLKLLTDTIEKNKYFKTLKDEEPTEYEIPNSTQKYINSWVFEDKIYLFGEDLNLYEYHHNNINKVSEVDTSQKAIGNIIDSAKTHFGLVFEDIENLYLQNSSINILSNNVTNWRTYPKSTNYQNHLHIIEDDYLTIQIFE
ncbi:hypothetical protein [Acinetobacter rongchengensis]|uniref:Uncharacterized protein n=1 Tax=Acinetobacter rongchengensis TaxID=2419601 RepID=A0A3A8EUQ6_9GAMM|nr:hypothetical protein [Acinetobacter rongchengensis]RKG37918.1 hypothetical protein D7V20_09215 [Acinetobacter rongchengensis]